MDSRKENWGEVGTGWCYVFQSDLRMTHTHTKARNNYVVINVLCVHNISINDHKLIIRQVQMWCKNYLVCSF